MLVLGRSSKTSARALSTSSSSSSLQSQLSPPPPEQLFVSKTSLAVLCNKNSSIRETTFGSIKLNMDKMKETTALLKSGKQIVCYQFITPQNQFANTVAAVVMGHPVVGIAVLCSTGKDGVTAAEIEALWAEHKKPKSWASMAKQIGDEHGTGPVRWTGALHVAVPHEEIDVAGDVYFEDIPEHPYTPEHGSYNRRGSMTPSGYHSGRDHDEESNYGDDD